VNYIGSLGLLASDSHIIIIAATQNEEINDKYKSSIQVIKTPIEYIWDERVSQILIGWLFPLLKTEAWQIDTHSVSKDEFD
jgi:hypothetical protein